MIEVKYYFVLFTYLLNRYDINLKGKSYELGQSAVKCMRGILECWIKQSHRVELFKSRQNVINALHVKFHLHTGISFSFFFIIII